MILALSISLVACSNDGKSSDTTAQTTVDTQDNPVIGRVDDQVINLDTFDKAFAMLELSYNKKYGEGVLERDINGKKLKDILKREMLTSLVDEIVLREYLTKEGFTINEEELNSKLAEFKTYINSEKDQAFFSQKGITDDFLKERIRMQMYLIEFHDRVQREVESKIDLDSPEKQSEVVKVGAQHILVKTLEEANQVVERLNNGETFEALAKELSQDPSNADKGGNLGFFSRGVMVKPFEDVAFSLSAGQVSEPVQTQFGFHIIKVNQVITIGDLKETEDGLAELAEIRSKLAEPDFVKAFESQMELLRSDYKIEQNEDLIIESSSEVQPTETETTTK